MTPEQILYRAAVLFDLTPAHLTGRARDRRVVLARWAAMLALREAELTLTAIAELLQRDHATIRHGIAAARELTRRDPEYAARVAAIARRAQPAEPLTAKLRRLAYRVAALDSGEQYWLAVNYGYFEQRESV